MFTGLIEEVGTLKSISKKSKSAVLTIAGRVIFDDLKLGDSVAVNGVCLTVTSFSANTFTADVMEVTLASTGLGRLTAGSPVNLERAMSAQGRFGGHIVSGHIDGTGTISSVTPSENSTLYTIATSPDILRYIIKKGSITIDGISLTVTEVTHSDFSVSIIPHTAKETILHTKVPGSVVNLENDILGKYIERLMFFDNHEGKGFLPLQYRGNRPQSKIDAGFLNKFGFM